MAVIEGVDASALKEIADLVGLSQKDLFAICEPEQTTTPRKGRLSAGASSALYRIALSLCQLDKALAGDMKIAGGWLRSAQASLKGRVPVQLLATHQGSGYVYTAIQRMG
jgi:uncharacterized protein (DUF2384 family)